MMPQDMTGRVLAHYRIKDSLGYGGMATVYRAEDINLQRDVAVKIFRPRDGMNADFLHRFEREARVLARLDHPHILPVYDYGEQDGLAFLLMPLMAGGSLRDRLQRGPLQALAAMRLMTQMLDALQYAHDRGLIHRDVKPGNMLFKGDGTLLLCDFGLVKVLSSEDTPPLTNDEASLTAHAITGTPDYMAPEQIMGNAARSSDIYAMGVVLYEMLAGVRPFSADNYVALLMKHLHEQPRPLRMLNPRIDPALEAVVMRALEKDAQYRYRDARDMRAALLSTLDPRSTPQWNERERVEVERAQSHMRPGAGPAPMLGPSEDTDILPAYPSHRTPSKPTPPPPVAREEQRVENTPAIFNTPISPMPPSNPMTPVTPASSPHDTIPTPAAAYYAAGQEPTRFGDGRPGPGWAASQPPSSPSKRSRRPLFFVIGAIVLVLALSVGGLLYAQSSFGSGQHTGTATPNATVGKQATGTVAHTVPVGATTTNCPAANKARAATLAPLALGDHQNVVYSVNEGTAIHPTFGTIKRREAINGTNGVEISKMAKTYILDAQVSQDAQWVLFTAIVSGVPQIRMVRVDGQGLQTLYCAPSGATINSVQWSYDQKLAVFNLISSGSPTPQTFLLDLTSGNVQLELDPQGSLGFVPVTWQDNTHVYMTAVVPASDAPPQDIYILDTIKGANQHDGDLHTVVKGARFCGSFDASYDSHNLLVSSCQSAAPTGGGIPSPAGPTTISIQPATGGTTHTLATLPQAVTMIRAISPTLLLLLIESYSGDTTHNGLWKMNADGSGLTRLSTDSNHTQSLCLFTQYAWSNLSRDGKMYALQSFDPATSTYNMYYGSLTDTTPTQFAGISNTELHLAGWTSI
jgi:eukaryotic-like serine/threonine-protein kinase